MKNLYDVRENNNNSSQANKKLKELLQEVPAQDFPKYVPSFDDDQEPPLVYVTKWADYTTKYGLGYQLSDLSTGLHSNDKVNVVAYDESAKLTILQRNYIFSDVEAKHSIEFK